mmetsp:Transcript_24420/g.44272  ORF Transcript_24420/g.44272 Transcript_24420/m.44272 type:complete len:335 (-) Transcript_24420:118-1122(-)
MWASRKLSSVVSAEVEHGALDVEGQQAEQEEERNWSCDLPPDEEHETGEHDKSYACCQVDQHAFFQEKRAHNKGKSKHANHEGQKAQDGVLAKHVWPFCPLFNSLLSEEVPQGWPQDNQHQRCCETVWKVRSIDRNHWSKNTYAGNLACINAKPIESDELRSETSLALDLLRLLGAHENVHARDLQEGQEECSHNCALRGCQPETQGGHSKEGHDGKQDHVGHLVVTEERASIAQQCNHRLHGKRYKRYSFQGLQATRRDAKVAKDEFCWLSDQALITTSSHKSLQQVTREGHHGQQPPAVAFPQGFHPAKRIPQQGCLFLRFVLLHQRCLLMA